MSYRGQLARLEQRRTQLIADAAAQRVVLAGTVEPWRAPVAVIDRGILVVRFFQQYPAMLAAAGVVALVLKPGPTWRWGRRAYVVWRAWRAFVRPQVGVR